MRDLYGDVESRQFWNQPFFKKRVSLSTYQNVIIVNDIAMLVECGQKIAWKIKLLSTKPALNGLKNVSRFLYLDPLFIVSPHTLQKSHSVEFVNLTEVLNCFRSISNLSEKTRTHSISSSVDVLRNWVMKRCPDFKFPSSCTSWSRLRYVSLRWAARRNVDVCVNPHPALPDIAISLVSFYVSYINALVKTAWSERTCGNNNLNYTLLINTTNLLLISNEGSLWTSAFACS